MLSLSDVRMHALLFGAKGTHGAHAVSHSGSPSAKTPIGHLLRQCSCSQGPESALCRLTLLFKPSQMDVNFLHEDILNQESDALIFFSRYFY